MVRPDKYYVAYQLSYAEREAPQQSLSATRRRRPFTMRYNPTATERGRHLTSPSSRLEFGGVAIYVDDVRAVLDFYRRAFGLATVFFDPEYDYGELAAGSAHLGVASHKLGRIVMPARYTPTQRGDDSFAFEVGLFADDVQDAFERAVAAGAVPVTEPQTMPWGGTVAYVRDIEGTLVVLCTRPKS